MSKESEYSDLSIHALSVCSICVYVVVINQISNCANMKLFSNLRVTCKEFFLQNERHNYILYKDDMRVIIKNKR